MAAFNYDQGAQPQARDDYSIMPEGDYVGHVEESEITENKARTGDILKLTWILDTEGFKGRKIWQRINVRHQTAEAQRIGQIELANVKAALGLAQVQITDTLQLHNKQAGLRIKIEKGTPGTKYDKDSNVVFDVVPASGVAAAPQPGTAPAPAPAPAATHAAAPAPSAAPAANTPPWLKKAA